MGAGTRNFTDVTLVEADGEDAFTSLSLSPPFVIGDKGEPFTSLDMSVMEPIKRKIMTLSNVNMKSKS